MIFCTAWNITVFFHDPKRGPYVTPGSAAVVWVSVGDDGTCVHVMMDVADMIREMKTHNGIKEHLNGSGFSSSAAQAQTGARGVFVNMFLQEIFMSGLENK